MVSLLVDTMRLDVPLIPFAISIRVERRPFRRPTLRLSIRRLMIIAAIPALILGCYVQILPNEPWAKAVRNLAAKHGRLEQDYREAARLAIQVGDASEAQEFTLKAEQERALRRKWERSLWHPWANAAPDP